MMSQARDRGFTPLVLETFRNSDYETRIRVPRELLITQEPSDKFRKAVEIRAPTPPGKPHLINGSWWYTTQPKKTISDLESITINDEEGSFVCIVVDNGEEMILQFPLDRKSVASIVKGNKVGKLYETKDDELFNLKLVWT